MNGWREEHCFTVPDEYQELGGGRVMVRKNIRQASHEEAEGRPAFTEWVCECMEMDEGSYKAMVLAKEYKTEDDVVRAIDDYTQELIEGGVL